MMMARWTAHMEDDQAQPSLEEGPAPDLCVLGSCDPCIFFATFPGCHRDACPFCHIHGQSLESPQRPGKQIRMRLKRTMLNLLQSRESSPDRAHNDLQRLARKSVFARQMLASYLEAQADLEARGAPAADEVYGQPTASTLEDESELESFLKGQPLSL